MLATTVYINKHDHGFKFEWEGSNAFNGCFSYSPTLEDDLQAEYGTRPLRQIIDDLCSKIKLYNVVVEETTVTEHKFMVYAVDANDAKHTAVSGKAIRVDREKVASEQVITACEVVDD
jgi:hypothetical protein